MPTSNCHRHYATYTHEVYLWELDTCWVYGAYALKFDLFLRGAFTGRGRFPRFHNAYDGSTIYIVDVLNGHY